MFGDGRAGLQPRLHGKPADLCHPERIKSPDRLGRSAEPVAQLAEQGRQQPGQHTQQAGLANPVRAGQLPDRATGKAEVERLGQGHAATTNHKLLG